MKSSLLALGRESVSAKDPRGVQSVEVGIGILFAFLSFPEPLKLRDIADHGNVSPAQAHTYLVSFKRLGLVMQDEETGKYRLGPSALDLAIARMQSFDALKSAERYAGLLYDQTGLTVTLSVLGAFGPTIVLIRNGMEEIYINTRVGTVYSLTGTASGMAFAAHLSEAEVRSAIELEQRDLMGHRRVGKVRSWESVQDELQLIRKNNFATISPNPVAGIMAISSPVRDHTGQVRMVFSILGTAGNPEVKPGSASCEALLAITGRMSFELGFAELIPLHT
jgi:DNA-binding IclR family transcriptional regulator